MAWARQHCNHHSFKRLSTTYWIWTRIGRIVARLLDHRCLGEASECRKVHNRELGPDEPAVITRGELEASAQPPHSILIPGRSGSVSLRIPHWDWVIGLMRFQCPDSLAIHAFLAICSICRSLESRTLLWSNRSPASTMSTVSYEKLPVTELICGALT